MCKIQKSFALSIWYNAKTKKVKLLLFHFNIFFIYKKIMYKYLSDFDYFLVMVKIFEKYSYIKKLKITHKNISCNYFKKIT